MQIIIQRELGTNNSTSDFDIAIKDGQVCVYMNDNVNERKSGISQQGSMQDDNNNYCDNSSTCIYLNATHYNASEIFSYYNEHCTFVRSFS